MKFMKGGREPIGRKCLRRSGRLLWRFLLLSFLWWVLTEGYPGAWWFGFPVVTLATLATLGLRGEVEVRWRFIGLARFLPFFLGQSLRGGIDVAFRALNPNLPLVPLLFDYPLRIPHGPARVFLANTVSLLPGTCTIDLLQEHLRVHVLDGSLPITRSLQAVEERVAQLFGIDTNRPGLEQEQEVVKSG
jgi:multicomponent Na+:H+ antiporter subunit E